MADKQSETINKKIVQVERHMLRLKGTKTYFENYDLLSYEPIFKSIEKGAKFKKESDCARIIKEFPDSDLEVVKVKISYKVEDIRQ